MFGVGALVSLDSGADGQVRQHVLRQPRRRLQVSMTGGARARKKHQEQCQYYNEQPQHDKRSGHDSPLRQGADPKQSIVRVGRGASGDF